MQPAEKNEDSATQSGRRGDNDDEVISTTSSVSLEHPDGQCQRTTRSRKWQKYSIVRLETQDIDTDELNFFHTVSHQVRRQASETSTQKGMTHILEVDFDTTTPFVKEDTAKELQNHARKAQDTGVGAVENAEVAEIECVETMDS